MPNVVHAAKYLLQLGAIFAQNKFPNYKKWMCRRRLKRRLSTHPISFAIWKFIRGKYVSPTVFEQYLAQNFAS